MAEEPSREELHPFPRPRVWEDKETACSGHPRVVLQRRKMCTGGGLAVFVPINICGFRVHFSGTYRWRSRAVLDILEVFGRVSGRTRCLHETLFFFRKLIEASHFNAIFVSPG